MSDPDTLLECTRHYELAAVRFAEAAAQAKLRLLEMEGAYEMLQDELRRHGYPGLPTGKSEELPNIRTAS